GLQTMQFYNVSIDPRDPLKRLIGGLQDNGTIWQDGLAESRVWRPFFAAGDGTSASGFHPTRAEVGFASFQSNSYFVNFRNGDQARWNRIGDPITAAGERATITASTGRQFMTFDRVNPDTQFTAFQHVWRTQNNGGDQTFLEANCRTSGSVAGAVCGDWRPLGVAYPFTAGSSPDAASRQPGDLTSSFYGNDRAGGLIVAAERSASDAGTLWAATSFGRVFVSKNADGPAAGVTFNRVDTLSMPNRFVTRIVADPANQNAAFISYSGFSAITPATPGHIFRVAYDPATNSTTVTSSDFDLGDLPVNTLAYDPVRRNLYAGTDFGPLVLKAGTSRWVLAGRGFPEVVMVDLEISTDSGVLVAATHGMGIYWLNLR
ncbi:MAG: exo-alpha-sialidase, partial [Vicinamibacterales bacterium]